MTRWFGVGLAVLALMGLPFLEATAQSEAAAGEEPVAEAGAAEGPGAIVTEVAPPVDELVVQESSLLVQDDLAPDAVIVGQGQPVGIEEAVAMAIRNGLDVEVERFGPLIADRSTALLWGAYDPTVNGSLIYDVVKQQNVNPLVQAVGTNRDRTQGANVGLTQLIPYVGASLDARFTTNSVATRSTFLPLDQQYTSTFYMTATVPLLRNVVWNQSWINVKLAGAQSEAAEHTFRQSLMNIVQSTVNAYWELVAARERVRVAQKSLVTARALLNQTRTQYEVGVVSQVEVVEAEAGVANREFGLIQAANTYRNSQDVLIDAILGPQLEPLTDLQVVPTADLTTHALKPIDLNAAVAEAFTNRPELALARSAIDQNEMNLKFAKSQRLPQLDLVGKYGYIGISGESNRQRISFSTGLPVPPGPNTPYGQSADNFFHQSGKDNYGAQAFFSVPIPNTRGRELVNRTEFELRRAQTSKVRQEQRIILDVRSAGRNLYSAAEGIEAAERRRLAAEEQLRAERIRLEHGESTPFEVLQREEDLVEAESQKIGALQSFHVAETALSRAKGTILDEHAVEVDVARKPVN